MSRLIVISGISGSGKTTLAKEVEKLGYKFFSVDDYKLPCFDEFGFMDVTEKKMINKMARTHFKLDLIKHMRDGIDIVVEFPFAVEWQRFFKDFTSKYNYEYIVVNCDTRDFEDIWEQKVIRDSKDSRHRAFVAKSYVKDKVFVESDELTDVGKRRLSHFYKEGRYSLLHGDRTYNDVEFRKLMEEGEF